MDAVQERRIKINVNKKTIVIITKKMSADQYPDSFFNEALLVYLI